jgi:hypothetical protein
MSAPVTAGDLVAIAGAFATPSGAPTDPTGLTFTFAVIEAFSGNVLVAAVSYVLPAAQIVKDGTGAYHVQLDTTGQPGRWVYKWVATGAAQAVSDGEFLVRQPLV